VTEEEATQERGAQTPPGWYPDPSGGDNVFYWDGSRWTGEVRVPDAPVTSRPIAGGMDRGRKLMAAGGIALAVSPVLTWVNVVLLGSLNLFQLFAAAGRPSGSAWAAVLAGGAAAMVAWQDDNPTRVRLLGTILGVIAGLLALGTLVDLRDELRETQGLATIGIGPYIAVGGCGAIAIGGFLTNR
jgi:hypothetical protein